jgi:hypothetical protein
MMDDGTGLIGEATNFTPFGLLYLGIMLVLILTLPRDRILLPFLLVSLYMTLGQQLVLSGLNFSVSRITLLFTWIRIVLKNEHKRFHSSPLDNWFIGWLAVRTVINIILWRTGGAIVANMGKIFDAAGTYYLFRVTVIDFKDLRRTVSLVCALAIPLSLLLLAEHFTGYNPFSVFGGVPEMTIIREGKLRCQGPFRHPILTGTFGATTLPFALFLVRDANARFRRLGAASVVACAVIVYASASSGPILASLTVIAVMSIWFMRRRMYLVRRALVCVVIALALVMKAPVWFILARMSDVIGMGGGYHRAALIDAAVNHFSEWAMKGTTYTAHWMPYQLSTNPNMADITNQFIAEGIDGGLLTLALFIGLFVAAYKRIGTAGASARSTGRPQLELLGWTVGASLTAHSVSYLSVTYFDQMAVFWFLCLAACAAVGSFNEEETLVTVGQPLIAASARVLGQELH